MPNLWIQSLQKFNEGKQMWCIPRKGTAMSDAVKNILQRKETAAAHRGSSVSLPIDRFVEEHTRLIEVLKEGDPKVLKAEAERQSKELTKELKIKTPRTKKVSKTINLEEDQASVPEVKRRKTVKASVPKEPESPKPSPKTMSKNERFLKELKRIVKLMKEHPDEVQVGYVGRFAAEGKRFRMSPAILQTKGEAIVFNDRDQYRLLIDLDYADNEISFRFAGGAEGIHPDLESPETVAESIRHLETAIAHQTRDNPTITGFRIRA